MAIDNREIIEIHQIGKETMGGNPVKREQIVIDEIEKELDISVNFHPYNRGVNNE